MPQKILHEITEATKQERARIEESKNRPRYFIFGKTRESVGDDGYEAVFEHVPDRVRFDADWSASALFRIGDAFVSGSIENVTGGLLVRLPKSELDPLGVDISVIQMQTNYGIEYIMDNRELMDHLVSFIERKAFENSPFLLPLTTMATPDKVAPMGHMSNIEDLNESQRTAVATALGQRVTFIWGPPGTGKTKTMAALASVLVHSGKRVLLAALSNMALDQLLLSVIDRLGNGVSRVSIARLGSRMDKKCLSLGRNAFQESSYRGQRAGLNWKDHVQKSSLVACNFAYATLPRAPEKGDFDCVIADEVSMASIPSLVALSCSAKQAFVLGGDPFQLPPIFPEDADEPNEWFSQNVFEKAGVLSLDSTKAAFLDTQYRMQDEIGKLVSEMFYTDVGGLHTGTTAASSLRGFDRRVLFVDRPGKVRSASSFPGDDEQRRYNEGHAEAIVDVIRRALEAGVPPQDVGVIAPYNAQVVQIRAKLKTALEATVAGWRELKVATVHSFQGQERRLVVVDITDDDVPPTHLTAKRQLLNVALSRAREQLVVVGNSRYLKDPRFFEHDEIKMFDRLIGSSGALES